LRASPYIFCGMSCVAFARDDEAASHGGTGDGEREDCVDDAADDDEYDPSETNWVRRA